MAILACFLWLAILSQIEAANKPASQPAAPPSVPPGCEVYTAADPGEFDITLIAFGPARERALVELYRPWQWRPFPTRERFRRSFANNGAPYIHQTYDRAIEGRNLWMSGKWIVKWELGDWAGEQRLNLTDADWTIAVRCYLSRFR
ncbi:MAG: hypothetical protein OXG53_09635 [Chloroflexi bacterium]|nr:hypothetical protein [Chloroflexota bacterium]